MDEQARMRILEMIDSGSISAEEGLQLLQAMANEPDEETPDPASPKVQGVSLQDEGDSQAAEVSMDAAIAGQEFGAEQELSDGQEPRLNTATEPHFEDAAEFSGQDPADGAAGEPRTESLEGEVFQPASLPEDVEKWRHWWTIPLWVGTGVTVLTGMLMYAAFASQGLSFWFVCLWFPFLLGVGLMAISIGSRRSRWLHVRVEQKPGERPQRIAISMPIPIRLTSWLFTNFGHYIPQLQDKHVGEILAAVDQSTSPDNPLYVEVNEDDGEKVRVYIG